MSDAAFVAKKKPLKPDVNVKKRNSLIKRFVTFGNKKDEKDICSAPCFDKISTIYIGCLYFLFLAPLLHFFQ